MKTVVGVQFYKSNKVYYFSPNRVACQVGDDVVVETARGAEIARVAQGPMEVEEDKIVPPLKNVLRLVTQKDRAQQEKNRKQEAAALAVFEKKIADHELVMKPVSVEYGFDGSNITFFFTADGRVDFRELVKDLAHHFHTRIELRQIGVRDEGKAARRPWQMRMPGMLPALFAGVFARIHQNGQGAKHFSESYQDQRPMRSADVLLEL